VNGHGHILRAHPKNVFCNYLEEWWRWEELNLRHGAYETPALPLSYTAKSRNVMERNAVYHIASASPSAAPAQLAERIELARLGCNAASRSGAQTSSSLGGDSRVGVDETKGRRARRPCPSTVRSRWASVPTTRRS
jgi:hypothetical protein